MKIKKPKPSITSIKLLKIGKYRLNILINNNYKTKKKPKTAQEKG